MKRTQALLILSFLCVPSLIAIAEEPSSGKTLSFDAELARKLGAVRVRRDDDRAGDAQADLDTSR
jgi:hypothetical protein